MNTLSKLLLTFIFSFSVAMADSKTLDTGKSVMQWSATKVTGGHTGKIYFKGGKVELEGDKVKSGEFIVDMTTFTVEDLTGDWEKKFIGHMKSGDFFEVEKYPTAKLVVQSANAKSLKGKLEIKGKSHPITIEFKKQGNKYTGNFEFDRTKYDMIYNSGNFFKDLGDKVIHNEVKVAFDVFLK